MSTKSHAEFLRKTLQFVGEIDCHLFAIGLYSRTADGKPTIRTLTNASKAWFDIYVEQFMTSDPRLKHGETSSMPFPWGITTIRDCGAPRMAEAYEVYGHHAGLGVPLRSNSGDMAGVFLTTDAHMDARDFSEPYVLGKDF